MAGPTEIDTTVFDVFTATSGTFLASSPNSGATLTFGVSGGTAGSTVIDRDAWQALGYDTHSFLATPIDHFVSSTDFHLLA